jgi:hypothetical protein
VSRLSGGEESVMRWVVGLSRVRVVSPGIVSLYVWYVRSKVYVEYGRFEE